MGLGGGLGGRLGGGLERGLKGGLGGGLDGGVGGGLQRGLLTGYGRGLAVKLRSGKVQVWFSLQPKFNSFELDSEVGRLVMFIIDESNEVLSVDRKLKHLKYHIKT